MLNKKENFLKISLQSFSSASLAKSVASIKDFVKMNFGVVIGPLMLPVKRRSFSIRRSPHIYVRSRETISMSAHKRVLYIMFDNPEKTINLESHITSDVSLKVSFNKLSYKRPERKPTRTSAKSLNTSGDTVDFTGKEKDFFKNVSVLKKNTRTRGDI